MANKRMTMKANDTNVMLLEIVAERLGDSLLQQMVFVGGAVAGLLITDIAMPAIRSTENVDLVVQATVLHEYHAAEAALKAQGFVGKEGDFKLITKIPVREQYRFKCLWT